MGKRLLALLLGLVMCASTLVGCGGSKDAADTPATEDSAAVDTEDATAEAGRLVLSATGFENKFSPFFANSADDMDIAEFVSLYMMTGDRVANPVLNGIEGETRAYNGTDYTYYGPADIVVTENEDGIVSVYCVGQTPMNDYTIQATVTEVAANG